MSYRDFINELKSNEVKKVYLIYGTEDYLIDKAWEALKGSVVTAFPEMNYTLIEGEDAKPDIVSAVCQTFPFGSEKRLVVVRNLGALKNRGHKAAEGEEEAGSSASEDTKAYVDIIDGLSESTCLALITYGAADKRKKLFNEVKKQGAIYEFNKVEKNDLSTWIKGLLNKAEKKIPPKELDYFIHLSGYLDKNSGKTLYDIENALNKLVAFMGEVQSVNRAHIEAVMPRNVEHDIFKLINACSERNISGSLVAFNDLLIEGESPLGILAMLSKQIKNIIGVAELHEGGYDSRRISEKLKIHEYTVKLGIKYCTSIKRNRLIGAINRCLKAETDIKSGKMNEKLALELLLTTIFD